ncbi:Putative uncharacterized protein [Candidatus Puniceispirillum marinum IMCC1322]|uniref:Uncharacterized protein n=1 Tax=Puniceispirillum marinum (strain IMCC1322) TaxID=488538 RepID=D5BQR8_PUNMI|nr:Putative uncharacterized protein [Candidatus Puniceispirillum marinum IMCC1322]
MSQAKSPTTTSCQPDIPASHSQLLDAKKAKKMTATSGRTSAKLLHSKDPLGWFAKTFMATLHWVSTRSYLIWSLKATPQNRLLLELKASVPPTKDDESGLSQDMWATPNTMDHLPQRSEEALKRQATTTRKGRTRPSNLREQVDEQTVQNWQKAKEPELWATPRTTDGTGGPRQLGADGRRISKTDPTQTYGANLADQARMWPTPLAQEAKHATVTEWEMTTDHQPTRDSLRVQVAKSQTWPTPTTRDHKGGYRGGRIRNGKVSMDTLDVAVQHTDNPMKGQGQLNPDWVEHYLMGYPRGWTSL